MKKNKTLDGILVKQICELEIAYNKLKTEHDYYKTEYERIRTQMDSILDIVMGDTSY